MDFWYKKYALFPFWERLQIVKSTDFPLKC